MTQDEKERIEQIDRTLNVLRDAWPVLLPILKEKADGMTLALIGQDSEQTRGRIKQLRELMELPETLYQERQGIGEPD